MMTATRATIFINALLELPGRPSMTGWGITMAKTAAIRWKTSATQKNMVIVWLRLTALM